MPRKPGASVVPHSEVCKRFRRPDIADQVLAALQYTAKTPLQIGRFLGLNANSQLAKNVETAMDKLIERRNLPIQKQVNQGKSRNDRAVKYTRANPQQSSTPRPAPAATNNGCKVWVDESVKGTWDGKTQADISAAKKQNWNQVAATSEARSKAERAKFRERLKQKQRRRSA